MWTNLNDYHVSFRVETTEDKTSMRLKLNCLRSIVAIHWSSPTILWYSNQKHITSAAQLYGRHDCIGLVQKPFFNFAYPTYHIGDLLLEHFFQRHLRLEKIWQLPRPILCILKSECGPYLPLNKDEKPNSLSYSGNYDIVCDSIPPLSRTMTFMRGAQSKRNFCVVFSNRCGIVSSF